MKKGFTLMEILIVIAIIAIIALILFSNLFNQVAKAHDLQRKGNLSKIQKSLDEYYNDNQTYPPATPFTTTNCGKEDASLYLSKIPCDPVTNDPYIYVPAPSPATARDGYVICAKLENQADPDIIHIGCNPSTGCGWEPGYNYCLSSGTPAVKSGSEISATPTPTRRATPTPTPVSGAYACVKNTLNIPPFNCNWYSNPGPPPGGDCPFTYQNSGCIYNGTYQCDNPANRCRNY